MRWVALICVKRATRAKLRAGSQHSEGFQTRIMGSAQTNPNVSGTEPELHLLLDRESFEEPLWKSLSRELDDFFFPKKLPPLKLESKPEPVKDIWGFYNNWKNGALGSTGVHVLIVAIIVVGNLDRTARCGRDTSAQGHGHPGRP